MLLSKKISFENQKSERLSFQMIKQCRKKRQVRVGKYILTFLAFPLQKNGCVEFIPQREGSLSLIPLLESAPSKVASSELEQQQENKS